SSIIVRNNPGSQTVKWHGRPAREDTRKMRVLHQTAPLPASATVSHEMGHKLDLDGSYTEKHLNAVMILGVTVGERPPPLKAQATKTGPIKNAATNFLFLVPL